MLDRARERPRVSFAAQAPAGWSVVPFIDPNPGMPDPNIWFILERGYTDDVWSRISEEGYPTKKHAMQHVRILRLQERVRCTLIPGYMAREYVVDR